MGIRHNRVTTRDFSVAGFIFTYVQKYFSGLTGGGAIAAIARHGSVTGPSDFHSLRLQW